MTKKIEDILFECLEDIKAGRASVGDCLKRHPSLRDELEPLLDIAVSLPEPLDVRPSPDFRARTRASLMEHIHAEKAANAPLLRVRPLRLRAATVALALVASIGGVGGGLAYASQDSLPGDNLYSVKLATEQFRRVLTVDGVNEVELELAFADNRVGEMAALANRGCTELDNAVNGYEKSISLALEKAGSLGEALESAGALERVALATSRHIGMLDGLQDSATAEAGIQVAQERAFASHLNALRGLAVENPVRAAEINLATMESRLNRAQTKVGENRIEAAETALGEFEELSRLGEEISQISKGLGNDSALVDELNARATAAHLETLGDIYGKMPEQTKGAAEDAMSASVETYDQAVGGLKEKGVLDDIPEQPPIPDNIPENVKERISQPETGSPGGSSNGSASSGGSDSGSGNSGSGQH